MNKTLARQLKRLGLSIESPPQTAEEWKTFLDTVAATYVQSEEDRYLLERSLEISSQEMSERLQKNKELNFQLLQASKLASLGTLASGIAHELNNPLQALKGYVELLQREAQSPLFQEKLGLMSKLSNRMASTIRHLLKLSRQSNSDAKVKVSILDPLNEAFELLNKQFQYDQIAFSIQVKAKDPFVLADSTQLFGVFQNLLSNSRDAFHSQKDRSQSFIQIEIVDDKQDILVRFRDNAGGIPAEILPRIFDPFFTTKEVGVGTGLGLALTQQTLESFGGKISVQVEKNETIFTIRLPRYNDDQMASAGSIGETTGNFPVPKMPTQLLSALIVDDEPDICSLLEIQMSTLMNVTTAQTGTQAKSLLLSQQYDLVISDLKMPGASGLELFRLARAANPKVKLVLMSGHLGRDLPVEAENFQPYMYFEKPFESVSAFSEQVLRYFHESTKAKDAA